MKYTSILVSCSLILASIVCRAESAPFQREKMELLVEQAGEMLREANQAGSATHQAAYRYYFGLVYGAGTNLLARRDSQLTTRLRRQYMEMIERNYAAYTKVEDALNKAAATGNDRVYVGKHGSTGNGSRHRAKRIANAEKLGDKEFAAAVKQWETFALQLKKSR